MKALIEDVTKESLEMCLNTARSESMKDFNGSLNSVNLDNNISNNVDKMFEVTRCDAMQGLAIALFQTFTTAMSVLGPIKAMEAVQLSMFTFGFNYASYLHEQRELKEFELNDYNQ